MRTVRILYSVLRFAGAAAIVAAIVGQLMLSAGIWVREGASIPLQVLNFFSFFTIDSNAASVVVLLIGGVLVLRPGLEPSWFAHLRVAVVTYMVVTGVVYNLLLRNIELPQGSTLPWSNEVLHVVGPVVLLADWLFAPGRRRLEWKAIRGVVVFPLVWVVYTLIRGPFTPGQLTGEPFWYPYPFLNPYLPDNNAFTIAFYVLLIAMIICVTAAGAVWVSRRRGSVSTPL
ncbi:MAG TPA: Pr6Pr family membrane protein [Rhodoglobus sp.]|nr:Pr6Pr family membrane protein [Rhodoglobus sp.]